MDGQEEELRTLTTRVLCTCLQVSRVSFRYCTASRFLEGVANWKLQAHELLFPPPVSSFSPNYTQGKTINRLWSYRFPRGHHICFYTAGIVHGGLYRSQISDDNVLNSSCSVYIYSSLNHRCWIEFFTLKDHFILSCLFPCFDEIR
jgi:hypothetical protein